MNIVSINITCAYQLGLCMMQCSAQYDDALMLVFIGMDEGIILAVVGLLCQYHSQVNGWKYSSPK